MLLRVVAHRSSMAAAAAASSSSRSFSSLLLSNTASAPAPQAHGHHHHLSHHGHSCSCSACSSASASAPSRRMFSTTPACSGKPSISDAEAMPREYYEYDNETLIKLASDGDEEAQKERLVREIMAVDQIEWDEAQPKVDEISAANGSGKFVWLFPYYVGILGGGLGAVLSVPMVFDLDTALWFNENYVTTEVAADEDLQTWLEVGSWTWNWMEPPLGGISFVLLALQFARAQMININFKPYTEFMLSRRANSLAAQFPQYDGHIVKQFSRGYAV